MNKYGILWDTVMPYDKKQTFIKVMHDKDKKLAFQNQLLFENHEKSISQKKQFFEERSKS